MLTDQETIKKIKSFGLNTYEVKIWTALLSRGVSTAGELSDIANVPRSRSYDVLESLEKKGFVIMKLGKPIKYLAVPPKEVMERVKKRIEQKKDERIAKITNKTFNKLINNLQETYENTTQHTESIVAILKGFNNIQKHLEYLFKNAKKDILLSVEKETERYAKILDNTKDRIKNIDVTLITNQKTKNQKENASIRTQNVGARMCVVDDDNLVVFPISEEDTHPDYDFGVWVKNKQITSFMKRLLESI